MIYTLAVKTFAAGTKALLSTTTFGALLLVAEAASVAGDPMTSLGIVGAALSVALTILGYLLTQKDAAQQKGIDSVVKDVRDTNERMNLHGQDIKVTISRVLATEAQIAETNTSREKNLAVLNTELSALRERASRAESQLESALKDIDSLRRNLHEQANATTSSIASLVSSINGSSRRQRDSD